MDTAQIVPSQGVPESRKRFVVIIGGTFAPCQPPGTRRAGYCRQHWSRL